MKKLLMFSALFLAAVTCIDAQDFAGIDKSPLDIASWKTARNAPTLAKVTYSRPMKNDREVWGGLIPYDVVWRTGANECTEITFYNDVTFGGEAVKAGTYSLFTIPGEEEWTFILNSNLNQWGAYQYDESGDVIRVKGSVGTNDEATEAFSITWVNSDDGSTALTLGWDDKNASVSVK